MRLPPTLMASERSLLSTKPGKAISEVWIYSPTVFAWKRVHSSSSNGKAAALHLVKEQEAGNSRLLVLGGNDGQQQVLCNAFVHPDAVLLQRDHGGQQSAVAFWVQDYSSNSNGDAAAVPAEVCIKLVFQSAAAASDFSAAYASAQKDMAQLHQSSEKSWRQPDRPKPQPKAVVSAPPPPPPSQPVQEEEEEEEDDEEDDDEEDYDEDEEDYDDEDDDEEAEDEAPAPKQGVDLAERARLAKLEGAWKCDDCYSSNPKSATQCMACEAPRSGGGGDAPAAAAPAAAAPKFSFAPPPATASSTPSVSFTPFSAAPAASNPFASAGGGGAGGFFSPAPASSSAAPPALFSAAATPAAAAAPATPFAFAPSAAKSATAPPPTTPFSFAAAPPASATPFSFAPAAAATPSATPALGKFGQQTPAAVAAAADAPTPLGSFAASLTSSLKEEPPVFTFAASPTLKPKPLSPRTRLTKYYEMHNPTKLEEVPKLLEKYKGKEDEMFAKLEKKYGASSVILPSGSTTSSSKPFSLNSPSTPPSAPAPSTWGASGLSFGGGGGGGNASASATSTPLAFGGGGGGGGGGATSMAALFNPNLANAAAGNSPAPTGGFSAFSSSSSSAQSGFGAAAAKTTTSSVPAWATKQ